MNVNLWKVYLMYLTQKKLNRATMTTNSTNPEPMSKAGKIALLLLTLGNLSIVLLLVFGLGSKMNSGISRVLSILKKSILEPVGMTFHINENVLWILLGVLALVRLLLMLRGLVVLLSKTSD